MKGHSRRLCSLTLVGFLAGLTLLGPAGEARAQNWIELVGGPSYQLRAGAVDTVTLPVPVVIVAGVAPARVTVEIRDVLYNSRHETQLMGVFRCTAAPCARVASPAPGMGPSILLPLDLKKAAGQGTYTVALVARVAGRSPVSLNIQIVYPVAKLRPVSLAPVERVWPWADTDTVKLPLEETAQVGLAGLSVRLRDFPARLLEEESIKLGQVPEAIHAGHSADLPLKLSGRFPLGTSSGTVEVRADQLAEPFTANLQVKHRVTLWAIPLIIVLGISVGYLVRTALQQRIELEEERQKAISLLDRIQADHDRRPDAGFRERLRQPLAELKSAVSTGTTATLTEKADAANKAWQAALQDLEQRLAAAQQTLDSFSVVATPPWSLPEEIETPRKALQMQLATAAAAIAAHDPTQTDRVLQQARDEFVGNLDLPLAHWRAQLEADLDRLATGNPRLPANVAERLRMALSQLQPLQAKVVRVPLQAPPAEAAAVLQAVHDLRVNVRDLALQLRIWLQAAVQEVIRELRQAPGMDDALLQLVRDASDALDRALRETAVVPENLPAGLLDQALATPLDEAVRDAIGRAAVGLSEPLKGQVENLVRARRYVEAARTAARPETVEGTIVGSMGERAESASATPDVTALAWVPRSDAQAALLGTRVLRREILLPPLEKLRARSFSDLFAARLLRTALIGLLILISGYLLFAPRFIGTFADLSAVFFWAFALDVTLDALTGVIPKRQA